MSFGVIGEPETLDPYSPVASDLTYELLRPVLPTLFRVDPQGRVIPDLAKTWRRSGAVVKVTLAKRTWSNGDPITAQDVKASFDRAGGSGDIFGAATQARVVTPHVRVLGPRSLLLESAGLTKQSFASPLFVLPHGKFVPSISGGPYKIASHTPGLQVIYTRNRAWAGPAPFLKRVAVLFIEDLDTMTALLQRGKLDAAAPPSAVNLDDRLKADGLQQSSALGWEFLALDFDGFDPLSRPAFESAISRSQLQQGLIRSDGRITNALFPAPGPHGADGSWVVPPGATGASPKVQLGVGKGDELTEQLQEVIQLQLQHHGSDAELVTGDARTFYGDWRTESPTDVSIVRIMGFPGALPAAEVRAFGATEAMPLFEVKSFVTWRDQAVQGLEVNPTIEGPLWDMQEWAKV